MIEWADTVASLIPGLSIAFEQPQKRAEIIFFCLSKSIEGLINLLDKRGISFPQSEGLVFTLAIGLMAAINTVGDTKLKGVSLKALKSLWI